MILCAINVIVFIICSNPTNAFLPLLIISEHNRRSSRPSTDHSSMNIMKLHADTENTAAPSLRMMAEVDGNIIVDPLLKYLNHSPASSECPLTEHDMRSSQKYFSVQEAINALISDGYYHIPSVLTELECNHSLDQIWDFVEDVSAGAVSRHDPKTWYPKDEVLVIDEGRSREESAKIECKHCVSSPSIEEDLDPWPHTGYSSFPDMFQSLGAGFVLGHMRELLAERIFEPLFGTRELICSKEGFTFCRPLVVDLDKEKCQRLVWNRYQSECSPSLTICGDSEDEKKRPLFKVCGKPQPLSEGQHYDQGVPKSVVDHLNHGKSDCSNTNSHQNKKSSRNQKVRDLTGLCYIQASVSFTNQSIDKIHGGGHFLCHPRSHSEVQQRLVGGTYRATTTDSSIESDKDKSWVPLTDNEIRELQARGYEEKRIYANVGDVILWRSDLVHAGVAPSLSFREQWNNGKKEVKYDGPKNFRAVGYCSMLPKAAVIDYYYYSLPKRKLKNGSNDAATSMLNALHDELDRIKLESYRNGRTGDHRPDVESWHNHRRTTMWNLTQPRKKYEVPQLNFYPPRLLQRPRFRLGPPELTIRQAELYGVLPYSIQKDVNDKKSIHAGIERAVIRGVRFVAEQDGDVNLETRESIVDTTVCFARLEFLTPHAVNGSIPSLLGQDKYLGGMSSPCGRYIFGVPGHAKRVIRVTVETGKIDWIGPEYKGEFKWLRGVEIPACGKESGCCLALPCNSEAGCVLKIDPETSAVSTFITGEPIPVEEGWLYHGGNLASDRFVYAIPASAPRVMKIDPWRETTDFIGPNFQGKAKWYGGIVGADGCIYGIPHNANGVLKIDPATQEVTILAKGMLPDGQWKWHGGLASSDGTKIIGFPNNADSILVINVVQQNVYLVGDGSILKSGTHRVPQDGRYKYLGGALTADGRFAYLFPCDAEHVLRMDMATDDLKLVGPRMTEGENKFQNGFVASDGCIYGIPQRASGILRIVPPGLKRWNSYGDELPHDCESIDVLYCGDDMVSCKDKFEGGVLGLDGSVYCIPLRAKSFVKVIPGPSINMK